MSVEKRLVAACLRARPAFEKITEVIDTDHLTPYSSYLIDLAVQFYGRDKEAKSIDFGYIDEAIKLDFDNPAKGQLYRAFAQEVMGLDISALNTADLVLAAKRKESATALAQALINDEATIEDIDEHRKLVEITQLEELDEEESDTEVINCMPVKEANEAIQPEGLIKIGTRAITDALGGGALKGHHITIFARPEIGKDAFVHTCAKGFALQKLPTLFFQNEDPIRSTVARFQGCLTGMTLMDRLRDPDKAQELLNKRGYEYVTFISIAPGSIQQIDRYCERFNPVCIIVNQLRNLSGPAENRTNQLEAIATGLRGIAKRRNCLVLSVTQAGDSASNKLCLEMGDVDSSNTGIPAQADAMIGIGCNEEFERNGLRMISFPKNKLSGKHIHFHSKINVDLSLYEDIA